MAKQFIQSIEDEANFSDCILECLTIPSCYVKRLREKRGKIVRDMGIRAVVIYTLCSTVLGRIAHVSCPQKHGRALRHLQTMFSGGISKKRRAGTRATTQKESGNKTRDRACAYVERLIGDYLAGDFGTIFGEHVDVGMLRQEMRVGDELLEDLVNTVEDSPSLRHILPISLFNFVFVLVDLMRSGDITCVSNVESKYVQEFRCLHLTHAFELITLAVMESIHSCSGIMVCGDGRPQFPSFSGHGRDGKVVKIALSHTALASALSIGARMKKDDSSRSERKHLGVNVEFNVETFFPLIMHAVLSRKEDHREYEFVMEEVEDFLSVASSESLVDKKYASAFLKSYDTLQKCNRMTLLHNRGNGVVFRSRYIPAPVLYKQIDKCGGRSSSRDEALKELDRDVRSFRRIRDLFLDSVRESIGENRARLERNVCPLSKELCYFLYHCVRLAEKVVDKSWEEDGEDVVGEEGKGSAAHVMGVTFRQVVLGLFSCDLSGNVATLYEDYIYSALRRHFDERQGVVDNLKAASKRRNVVRRTQKKRIFEGKGSYHEDESDTAPLFTRGDEEWGPSRDNSPE